MTKLVFHLGDMKTGSTAIQTALSSKGWKCDSVKLLYPVGSRVSHITFAQSLSGRVDGSRTAKLARSIANEINRNPDADVAVISAEHFESVDPKVLKQTIETYFPGALETARFIAYVRPHADRFPSTYAERVKTGMYVGTLEELHAVLHARESFVYTPRFTAWRETFGSAFELRPMIRDLLYRKDVVADFMSFALQTEDFTLSDTPDANESLSLENLSIVREFHVKVNEGKNKGLPYQSTIGRALARRMNESAYREGTKVRIHRSLAETVREQYAADAAALDAAFFSGTPMSDALNAAPGKAVAEAQSVRIEDHFSTREQYLINTLLGHTAVLIKADPQFLADSLRIEHRSKVTADDEDGAVAPKRRRLVRGRKADDGAEESAKKAAKPNAGKAGAGRRKIAAAGVTENVNVKTGPKKQGAVRPAAGKAGVKRQGQKAAVRPKANPEE